MWLLIVFHHTVVRGTGTNEVVAESTATTAACAEPTMPPHFLVAQQVQSSVWRFKITNPSETITYGVVEEDLFAYDTTLTWVHKNKKVAAGVQASITMGNEIVIRDCQRKVLATIEEKTFTGYATKVTKYRVLNAKREEVAISARVEWSILPHIIIKSPHETRTLASLKRPLVSWGEQWHISRNLGNATYSSKDMLAEDPRVLTMLAVFKTASHASKSKSNIWWIVIGGPTLLCCCFSLFIVAVYKRLRESAQEVVWDNFDGHDDSHDHTVLIKQEDFSLYKYNQVSANAENGVAFRENKQAY